MKIEEVEGGYYLKFGARSCFKPYSCKSCPLFENLKIDPDHTEFKSILFIGEGPGRDERVEMKPFTGQAGQLIRATVEDTEAKQFGWGYSNIILCEGGKKLEFDDPDALWQTIDLCTSTFLWDEIEDLKPKVVIPAGNFPKSVILPGERKGIGAIAGLLYSGKDWYYNFDTIPVHHPAHILRNPKMFENFWDEINEVRLYFTQQPGPFHVHMGSLGAIEKLWNYKGPVVEGLEPGVITVDTETTSFHPQDRGDFRVNGRLFHRGDVICMSLCADTLNSYIFTPGMIRKWHKEIKELLETKGVSCHNGPFDIPFLIKYGLLPELKDDTMLMSYSKDESPRHGLKRLSRRHLGLEDWGEDIAKYMGPGRDSYAFIPFKELSQYCGMDTATASTLRPYLWNKMDENERKIYRNLLVPCANMFAHVSYKGFRVDLKKIMTLRKEWLREQHGYILRLRDFGIANPNSPYQVSDALKRYGVVDYDAVTVKANLKDLGVQCELNGDEKGLELCTTVVLYREVKKAIDTFLLSIAANVCEGDLRVHPDFKLFNTVTGRMGISDPGLLAYPKATRFSDQLREVLIPDPGYVWGHRDQKTFELRVLCVIGDDKVLKVIFAEGKDPHAEVIYAHMGRDKGETPTEVLKEIIRARGEVRYKKLNKMMRDVVRGRYKAIVFGDVYGRGDESVASQLGRPIEEAREIRSVIDAMIPGIPQYRIDIEAQLNEQQEIINPLGRKRRFPILTPENYHEALLQAWNFPIQSTASDLNLLGMYDMWKSPYQENLFPFFPIHDAIEYQVKESMVDEIEAWVTETLSNVPRQTLGVSDVKFVTDSGLGYSWAEASL